jgi:hypothetical protein
VPWQAFSSGVPVHVTTVTGVRGRWAYDYVFDYRLQVPMSAEPGTYKAQVTFTVLER